MGETARIPENNLYVQSGDVGLVIPDENVLDKSFAYYLIASPVVKRQLDAATQQTKIRHTSPDKIKNCEVWIPEMDHQKKTGAILDTINATINNNNAINTELESTAKAIYYYWFLQFDFPNEEGKSYKSSGGKMVWNEEFKREIPEGWELSQLGDIFNESPKSTIKAGETDNGECPFFTSGNNTSRHSKPLTDGRNCYLNTGGNAGVKFFTKEASYSTDTWCITGKDKYEDYLYLFLISILGIIQTSYFAGSGLKHLQKSSFKEIAVVAPPIKIMKKFNNIVNPMFDEISQNYYENQELYSLRDFLLPMLMNGQVGFKEAQ